MLSKRGCFSALQHYGYVFVFGGLNYNEKILRKAEKYDVQTNAWTRISPMIEARKNSSACALTADSIYVFGGTSLQLSSSDSIEVYSVATDSWTLLRVRLPNPVAFLLSFKVSETEIALLGGSVRELTKRGDSYKTNQVMLFNAL